VYCLGVPSLIHEIQYMGNITAVFSSRGTFCIVFDPPFWRKRVESMGRQKELYYELYIPIYIRYSNIYSLLTRIFLCFNFWTLDFSRTSCPCGCYLSINGTGNLRIFWYPRRYPCKVWIIFCILIATNHTHLFMIGTVQFLFRPEMTLIASIFWRRRC